MHVIVESLRILCWEDVGFGGTSDLGGYGIGDAGYGVLD